MSVPVRRYLGMLLQLPHQQRTIPRRKVLPVMKEPGIHSGYRMSGQSWTYYILSALQIHNETANIWTHGLAVPIYLIYLAKLVGQMDLSDPGCIGIFVLCFGLVVNAMSSSIAHLLHSKSQLLHHAFFMLDYMGIAIYGQTMGILIFYCSGTLAFYQTWGRLFLPINMLSSVTLCGSLCVAKSCFQGWKGTFLKVSSCLSYTLFMALPLYYRLWDWLVTRQTSGENLEFHFVYCASTALSGFFFASHIPEILWPGKFDLIGHSHILFHIAVVHTGIKQMAAGFIDLHWQSLESKAHVQQISLSSLVVLAVVGLACMIATICVLLKMVNNDLKKLRISNCSKTK